MPFRDETEVERLVLDDSVAVQGTERSGVNGWDTDQPARQSLVEEIPHAGSSFKAADSQSGTCESDVHV